MLLQLHVQALWASIWRPFGSQFASKASKTGPKRSKIALKTPWIAQAGPRRLQTCPGAFQTSIFGRCLVDSWLILVDFWSIFGWFFERFFVDVWSIFNRVWAIVFVSFSRCFMDLLLCYFVLGAVAGSQLCCAVDIYIYRYYYYYSI